MKVIRHLGSYALTFLVIAAAVVFVVVFIAGIRATVRGS